jgi:acetate kinase
MQILTINCGSSSLKFALFGQIGTNRSDSGQSVPPQVKGSYKEIGSNHSTVSVASAEKKTQVTKKAVSTHAAAWHDLISILQSYGSIDAVGYRIVHGGRDFRSTTLLDRGAVSRLAALSEIAPLHNKPAIEVIQAGIDSLPESVSHFGVFDTAFHAGLPPVAARYPISAEYFDLYAVKRYGFHGLAHQSMLEISARLAGTVASHGKVITLQLGNGCSGCAIDQGKSVDTSMGFSPLEGLMMGTRSGDIDPMILHYLNKVTGRSYDQLFEELNRRSGLLGVSGTSSDMQQLLAEAEAGHENSRLAVDLFVARVTKLIGSYLAILGGADRIVFGGGIGANSPEIRGRILESLGFLGLRLNPNLNASAVGQSSVISSESSAIPVYAVEVDEERIIRNEVEMASRQPNLL